MTNLIANSVKAKFKGQTIEFRPLSAKDTLAFLAIYGEQSGLEVIDNPEFIEVLSKSTGIPKEEIEKSTIGFRAWALDKLLEAIDIDFFLAGSTGLQEKMSRMADLLSGMKSSNTSPKEDGQSTTS